MAVQIRGRAASVIGQGKGIAVGVWAVSGSFAGISAYLAGFAGFASGASLPKVGGGVTDRSRPLFSSKKLSPDSEGCVRDSGEAHHQWP